MLSKNQIAQEVEDITGIKPNLVKRVMDAISQIAVDEVQAGNDFSLPGVAKVEYRYTSARKKGEMYKKGDEKTGFGGITEIAENDSPARKASIKLRAVPATVVKRHMPKQNDPPGQKKFMTSAAGKNVTKRKG